LCAGNQTGPAQEKGYGVDDARYRWVVLLLSGATATFALAMPTMAMPVLFAEIADDLGLTLVQIGAVWGTVSFAGLFAGLVGGVLGDRFGVKRTVALACLLLGIAGASRGLAGSLSTMTLTVFLSGLVSAAVPMNLHKVCATWFSGKSLGLANAIISGGMALGFATGALVSATILSPWLGGWRNVLFFYGALAVLMSVPWAMTRPAPRDTHREPEVGDGISIRRAIFRLVRLRSLWALGIALLGIGGAVQGVLGYLPLYLRGIGWPAERADASLASFHMISLLVVLPLALLAGRLGSKTRLLIAAALMVATGIGLLSITQGALIIVAILICGAVRDGYMAVFMTAVIELDGVGVAYSGTALGLVMTLLRIGGLLAPPLGNSLAVYGPRIPFLMWSAMALLGAGALLLVRDKDRRLYPSDSAGRGGFTRSS